MTSSRSLSPSITWKIVAAYAAGAASWIVGSDLLLEALRGEAAFQRGGDTIKGLLFVAATSALLALIVRRLVRRCMASEEAMRERQIQSDIALQGAGDGLWDWNIATGSLLLSPQSKRMFGYQPEEISADAAEWMKRIHPDDRSSVDRELQRHFSGESGGYRSEHRILARDGNYQWAFARGQIVARSASGQPLRMVGVISNVTDRKQQEARNADALAFQETVLRASPVGLITFRPEGDALSANGAAADAFGTTVENLLRWNFRKFPAWAELGLVAAADRALESGLEVAETLEVAIAPGRTAWLEFRFVPFGYHGQPRLLAMVSDETAKRRAMETLNLLDAALQAAPSAWVITNASGIVEWVNPAFTALTGYRSEEVVGQTLRLLKSHKHNDSFYRDLWDTILRGDVWSGELHNRRKDGTLYHEHMTVAPVKDGNGGISHFVAIKHDVTAQKELERQLAQAQRLESVGMLASGIAHDLNNVLTPIMLSTELLRMKYPAAAAQANLDAVAAAAERGAGIVRQVLLFARGMDGGERIELQPRHLVKDVVGLISETFPRNIEICRAVPDDLWTVVGDVTQLHQVLLNLAVNARDAMPGGGTLTFGAANQVVDDARARIAPNLSPGKYVVLSVADTGTGISPDVIGHIFEPFYTTKPRGKGTGLGLSTAYGIVRSHRGIIEVKTSPGEGTRFDILLPAVARGGAGTALPFAARFAQGHGQTILVVDDEEPIRQVASEVLERHGYVPATAGDGIAALELVRATPLRFSAAVVDLMMPRMGGLELIQELRRLLPSLPVIASSGHESGTIDSGSDLGRLGVRTFLRKPYAEEALLAALGNELDARKD